MEMLAWSVTALVVALVVSFAAALLSWRRIPVGERPRTRTFDRFGRLVGVAENPDFHEQPGEEHAEALKLARSATGGGAPQEG